MFDWLVRCLSARMAEGKTTEQRPGTSRSLELHFSDDGCCLDQVLFTNGETVHHAKCVLTSGARLGTFSWTRAVKCLCLLFVKCAKSVLEDSENPVLTGGAGSAAKTLIQAIGKRSVVNWWDGMFGDGVGEQIGGRLFDCANLGARKGYPNVRVSLNEGELPRNNITIYRNRTRLTLQQLVELEKELQWDLDDNAPPLDLEQPVVLENDRPLEHDNEPAPEPTTVELHRSSQILRHALYQEIWGGTDSLEKKIDKTRSTPHLALPFPYVTLLYKLSVTARANGDAEAVVEATICNCDTEPLERVQQDFFFDVLQPLPFPLTLMTPGEVHMGIDSPTKKRFQIKFLTPVEPGGTRKYRFCFSILGQFTYSKWVFYLKSLNHYIFEFFQETSQRLRTDSITVVDTDWKDERLEVRPIAVNWDNGLAMLVHVPFPRSGDHHLISWSTDSGDQASE